MAEGSNDYSTGNPSGRSFLGGRWTFTGREGFRVVPEEGGTFGVVRYNEANTSPLFGGTGLTEHDAHAMAAHLSGRPVGYVHGRV